MKGSDEEPYTKKLEWDNSFIFDVYDLAKEGHPDSYIAQCIGVDKGRFALWVYKKPLLSDALCRGRAIYEQRKREGVTQSSSLFVQYIYDRLPDHLQGLWDKISLCQNAPNGARRIEALFADAGERARQCLWVHAMISTNFNKSEACRRVNVGLATVNRWIKHDPDFPELLDEVNYHQKNFFESGLTKQVAEGNIHAILFANRTFNKDRGYGDSKEIKVTGQVTHTHLHGHIVLDPEELGLPLEVVETVLKALEEKGYRKQERTVVEAVPSYYLTDKSKEQETDVISQNPEL